ncbi:MAG: flavodoxin family protein [Firmicutes bacterium]|nr:flavodoxin family protein [Bacillota bacterium]
MKVLLINGSPNEKGCTGTALQEVADTLIQNGVDAEVMWLGKQPMQDCIACHKCQGGTGCIFKDVVNETVDIFDEFDGLVVGSPVYYGGPTGRLTSFLDRFLYSGGQEKAKNKIAASVVSCRRGGATSAFQRLNQFFLMCNMHVAGSQYWNQVHGFTSEDVVLDEEGMQTMRTLGQNMAYLIKAKAAANEAGIEEPVYEEPTYTHFIR